MRDKIKKELSLINEDTEALLRVIKDAVNSDTLPIDIKLKKILTIADILKGYDSQKRILESILED